MRRPAALALAVALCAAPGCGKKGPLLEPLVRTPQKVEALRAVQRGDRILVGWRNPDTSVDGSPLAGVSGAEVWVLEQDKDRAAAGRMTAKEFAAKAKLAGTLTGDDLREEAGPSGTGPVFAYPLTGKAPAGLRLRFSVRVKDARSRESEFADPVVIEPRIVPGPPRELEARVLEVGVELSWKAPEANADGSVPARVAGYNIYRRDKDGRDKALNAALVREPRFEDQGVPFGEPVRYLVRASSSEVPPYYESSDSEVREVVPEDVFPPAPPAGVVPVAGRGFISLSWQAGREKDLAGYRVRRREEGGAEEVLLSDGLLLENAFTDTRIEKGKRYRYSMTAVDLRGNESARAEAVVEVPGDEPR